MWMQISSGRGPEESRLAVGKFAAYISAEFRKTGAEVHMIDSVPGSFHGCFKSVTLVVSGLEKAAFTGYDGTILWICPSPYRERHKRKNWFFDCRVYAEPEPYALDIDRIRVETMRSSGNGGQNVNKVESAVRITHLPSGLTVSAREERSQSQNKRLAIARLTRMLKDAEMKREDQTRREMWRQHDRLVRGRPVKVFEGISFKPKARGE